MAIYQNFSQCYDIFMAHTPYDQWVAFIEALFTKNNKQPSLVLELACGTGSVTQRLAQKGYNMIGLDNSAEMLSVASNKNRVAGSNVLYVCQDMRRFELYGTVDCVLCLCDGLNYILDKRDLLKIFKLVKNYLNPGGLFIFDLNTEYKYEHVLGGNTFAEDEEGAAYIWQNYYDKKRRLNEYAVTFFVETTETLYCKFEETHSQRAYSSENIYLAAQVAGLSVQGMYDMDKPFHKNKPVFKRPRKTTERICFVLEG